MNEQKQKRITPADVKAAYEKTGIKACCDCWAASKNGVTTDACALTVLFIAAGSPDGDLHGWIKATFGRRYAADFSAGYAGMDGETDAHRDGRSCRAESSPQFIITRERMSGALAMPSSANAVFGEAA